MSSTYCPKSTSLLDLPNELLYAISMRCVKPLYYREHNLFPDEKLALSSQEQSCYLSLVCQRMVEPGRSALYRHIWIHSDHTRELFSRCLPMIHSLLLRYTIAIHISNRSYTPQYECSIDFLILVLDACQRAEVVEILLPKPVTLSQLEPLRQALHGLEHLDAIGISFKNMALYGGSPPLNHQLILKTVLGDTPPSKIKCLRIACFLEGWMWPKPLEIGIPIPSLILNNYSLSDQGLVVLRFFKAWIRDTGSSPLALCISGERWFDDITLKAILQILGSSGRLIRLDLAFNDSWDASNFEPFSSLQNLRFLSLYMGGPTDTKFSYLSPSLEKLVLHLKFLKTQEPQHPFQILHRWLVQRERNSELRYLELHWDWDWDDSFLLEPNYDDHQDWELAKACDLVCSERGIATRPSSFAQGVKDYKDYICSYI